MINTVNTRLAMPWQSLAGQANKSQAANLATQAILGKHMTSLSAQPQRSYGTINPLFQSTRLNASTIAPSTLAEGYEAENLSHHDWLATLAPEVRHTIDSHGNAEHLAHITCSKERAKIVSAAEQHLVGMKRLDELHARASRMGLEFVSSGSFSGINGINQIEIAFFQGDAGGKLLIRFESGREMLLDVPPGFSQEDFLNMIGFPLQFLFMDNNLMDERASEFRLMDILEDFFDRMFSKWQEEQEIIQ